MREVRIFWLPAAFAALGAVAIVACDDGPTHEFAGYAPYAIGQSGNATEPADSGSSALEDAAPDGAAKLRDGGAATAANDAGDLDAGDDGGEASVPDPAFADAGPYVASTGTSTLQPQHNFAGNTPTTNPSKQACLTCHKIGGPGVAFVFAGSVFTDATGTTPAVGIEVRVRDSAGSYASVYTDAYGNFYDLNVSVNLPAQAGARNAAATQLMTANTDGNCNACHNGAAQAYIHVP